MNVHLLLLSHVLFGMICLIGALWVFVDALHVSDDGTLARIRGVSVVLALAMWIAFVLAGYWYIVDYPADKVLIRKGPWPAAHNFFMETKEHLVILLLLAATFLPIAARDDLVTSAPARRLVLWTAGLVFVLALAADGFGGIISMGVRVALHP